MRLRLKRRRTPATSPETATNIASQRLASLINNMADGVLAVDKNVHVVTYNGAALNILDRNDPIEGKPLSSVFKPLGKDNKPVAVTPLVTSAHMPIANRDLHLAYADGSNANLYISIAPVHLGYGEQGQQGYVILLRDITREKSLEEERDEFISVVSHELRTPIAITEGNISNAQYIVEKTGDISTVKDALKQAHDQVLFLADLVNDLSMLSRAERGVVPVDVAPIDMPELFDDLQKNYGPQAAAKGLKLAVVLPKNDKLALTSSKLYLREVLQNFITNSIKYTEKGSVTVTAKSFAGGVVFSVSDTGIGISHADQQRVFEKFFRSGDYRTTKAPGTGLGLYVTAKLARMLEAHIDVDSTLNKGSTFSISVPNMAVPVKHQVAAPAAPATPAPAA
jgi:two-component system sensor histidine kinase VicK